MKKRINKVRPQAPKKQARSNVSFVNLSSYTTPEIVESRNKEWIEFGTDNDFFNFLIDKANGSATNSACINSISQMIYGKGLSATDSARRPEQYARMISLFKKDDLRRFAYDLKLTGQCAIQVIYSKNKKTIEKVDHLPIETLRAEKCGAEDKEVQAYYYFPKWEDIKPSDKPLRIPAFGVSDTPKPIEILYVKPYEAGMYYYSTPDYIGGIQYADLEIEVSNYHINNVRNGLSPSMMINFNNGVPDEETQVLTENKIKQKYQGSSRAGTPIIAFNDNKESAATIEAIQLSDAHNQYQFINEVAQSKILIAHRIVSPMLLGIKDNSGFGNNAEELKDSSILMNNMVIAPFQELLTDAFDKILAFNNISLNLYFKTLQPLQFLDLDNVEDKITREEETGVKMSKENKDFNDDDMLDALEGDSISDEWELVDEREASDENESIEDWANGKIKEKLSIIKKFADVIKSKPNGFSVLDKSFYKVRYKYAEKYSSGNSRKFCKNMMSRSSKGVVYRLEDIDKASREGVNKSMGHKGQSYDLFKYKGSVNCGHFWNEQLYRLKKKTEKGTKYISKYDETNSIPKSYKPRPSGHKKAEIAPKDMKDNGHHPNYKG
jgi:hypothetical protein